MTDRGQGIRYTVNWLVRSRFDWQIALNSDPVRSSDGRPFSSFGAISLFVLISRDRPDCTMITNYLLYTILHLAFSVIHLSISTFLTAISALHSYFERISSILFELASDFYGVPPRASFPTEKCAILILGAQEGASYYSFHSMQTSTRNTQVWEETRRCHSQSWAIPSLHCVPIDMKSLDPMYRLGGRGTWLR